MPLFCCCLLCFSLKVFLFSYSPLIYIFFALVETPAGVQFLSLTKSGLFLFLCLLHLVAKKRKKNHTHLSSLLQSASCRYWNFFSPPSSNSNSGCWKSFFFLSFFLGLLKTRLDLFFFFLTCV